MDTELNVARYIFNKINVIGVYISKMIFPFYISQC